MHRNTQAQTEETAHVRETSEALSRQGLTARDKYQSHVSNHAACKNVVVVIPTSSRSALLERTLASLSKCEIPERVREIRVIENGPRCGAESITAHFAESLPLRYLHTEQANKSLALNQAIADLSHELVIFFDDDLRFSKKIISAYCEASDNYTDQRFFGGPFKCDYVSLPADQVLPFLPVSARGWSSMQGNLCNDKFFIGFNWAAYARDIKACGHFDERFGPGSSSGATGQETSLQSRLMGAGCEPVYVAEALVWHFVPETRCSRDWTMDRMFKNGIEHGQRHAEETQSRTPPRWLWRKLIEAFIAVGWSLCLRNEERVLHARMHLQHVRGIIRGIQRYEIRRT